MIIIKPKRNTIQRMKILEFLRKTKTHPNAESIYKEIIKQIPTITLATVYRNLNLLAENGEILRLEINKEYRYDGFSHAHIHCVCQDCKKIIDIEDQNQISQVLNNIPKKDFFPKEVEIMIKGKCKACSKKK